jgi:hypothetical protein
MKSFEIDMTALRTVLPLVAKKDILHPIREGICCWPGGLLVATDGYALGIYRDAHNSEEEIVFRVPAGFRAVLKKPYKKVIVHKLPDQRLVRLETPDERFAMTASIIGFPYYRKETIASVFRDNFVEQKSFAHFAVSPDLLKRFGDDPVRLYFSVSGNKAVVRTKDKNFIGLVISGKNRQELNELPGREDGFCWLFEKEEAIL